MMNGIASPHHARQPFRLPTAGRLAMTVRVLKRVNLTFKYKSLFMSSENPPVFKKWSHWYGLLLGALVVQIILYLWLTISYS